MPSSYTLGAHYESFVSGLLTSGRYASASEIIRDALRLLEDREAHRKALLAAIEEGENSGPAEPFDMAEIRTQAHAMKAAAGRG